MRLFRKKQLIPYVQDEHYNMSDQDIILTIKKVHVKYNDGKVQVFKAINWLPFRKNIINQLHKKGYCEISFELQKAWLKQSTIKLK